MKLNFKVACFVLFFSHCGFFSLLSTGSIDCQYAVQLLSNHSAPGSFPVHPDFPCGRDSHGRRILPIFYPCWVSSSLRSSAVVAFWCQSPELWKVSRGKFKSAQHLVWSHIRKAGCLPISATGAIYKEWAGDAICPSPDCNNLNKKMLAVNLLTHTA